MTAWLWLAVGLVVVFAVSVAIGWLIASGDIEQAPFPPEKDETPRPLNICPRCHGLGEIKHPSFDDGYSECPQCFGSGVAPVDGAA